MSRYYRTWTSDNTRNEPPKDAPIFEEDQRTAWERMSDEFHELQRRGW